MGRLVTLVLLVSLVSFVPAYGTMMLKSCRYDARFELEGYPKVGNEFILTLKVKAVYASPMTQIRMSLPKNVTMLGSDTTWQGSLEPGDSVLLPVHLRIDEIGAYCFSALIKDAVEDTHYFPYNVATCCIVSNEDTGFVSDTLMPYNLDLEISPKELKEKFPESKDLFQIRIHGQVKCLNKSGQEEVMPGVLMLLFRLFPGGPILVNAWHTGEDGTYDVTSIGALGFYMVQVASHNDAGALKPPFFPSWTYYNLGTKTFGVLGGTTIQFSPIIDGVTYCVPFFDISRREICHILNTIRYAKLWCQDYSHFRWTKEWVGINYPMWKIFGAFGTFYMPWYDQVFYEPVDAWHKGFITHEWAHSLMMDVFRTPPPSSDPKIPWGWTWAEHTFSDVRNPEFAFAEGFAEFMQEAVVSGSARGDYECFWPRGPTNWKNNVPQLNDYTMVEGFVMQYLWDLFDKINTPGFEPDRDDENISGKVYELGCAMSLMGVSAGYWGAELNLPVIGTVYVAFSDGSW